MFSKGMTMLTTTIKNSISRKFMLAAFATTCAALLISGIAMLVFDIQNFKSAWVDDLTTQSDILSQVTLPALEFSDMKVATQSLQQLKARPNIFAAAIYDREGKLFAVYRDEKRTAFIFPRAPDVDGIKIVDNQITIFKSILRNGEKAGTVYIEAQYPLSERVTRYLAIFLIVMVASLIFTVIVSYRLQAAITKPILAVTDAANQVVLHRDFSRRVKKSTHDEIGVLVDAFNSMLDEVGQHAQALEKSNDTLKAQVEERIAAEQALFQLNNTLEERIKARAAELERTHELLRQSQKMEAIGQLTGGVAHDFNNVLQVITGNLQLLQLDFTGNSDAQRRLETASYAAERGSKLSSQLLAFARRQPLQPVSTNLARLIGGMSDLLQRALGEAIEIETIVGGGLWNTLVDTNQLENVILNLAINARDAMKTGGKLTLEVGNAMLDDQYVAAGVDIPAGQYVMLAISDTGTGMSQDVMERVFEPFFTTKKEGEGTGLGLSMAYGFVKQSNGHIRIYSEPGNGTTVRIYLPRSFLAEVDVANVDRHPATGGTETILVVEDDLTVQSTAVDTLSGLGYVVLKANDGDSALALLKSGMPIDLLFTDVVMPGAVRSPELAEYAKRLHPEIAVLFTSGYTQNAIVHGGRLDPGVELISKPYRRDDLARKIRQLLAGKRPNTLPGRAASVNTTNITPPTMPLKILVVEDNEDARTTLCELLMLLGYQPRSAPNAEAALQAVNGATFDVLLTDVTLPGKSGLELATIAHANSPNLKVVFSSGHGPVSSESFPFKIWSLPKPYTLQTLQSILAEIETIA
jgi:signal transduction histidine kinase/DNA-binding response OmpR family regulator